MRNKQSSCHPSFSLENVKGSSNYKINKSGRSLDLAYQLGAMTIIGLFSYNAHATCTPTPDCASIGYTETSCEGNSLKCPFDTSKLFCVPCDSSFRYNCSGDNITGGIGSACGGKYVSCECSAGSVFKNGACACDDSCTVGAIYYSDGTCSACVDSNKTAIGVVVKDNELVISQIRSTGMEWGGYGTDISTLTNYSSYTDAKTDFSGKDNTAKIVAHFGEDVDTTLHAGVFCHKYTTEGTNAGDWYLPAAGELYSYVYGNYSKLLDTWKNKLAWDTSFSYDFWSSSEYNSKRAWYVGSDNGGMYNGNKSNTRSVSCFLAIN